MRLVVSRLGWQAGVAVVACFVCSLVAGPVALAQPKPEPATKKQVGPLPEPQKPQAPTATKPPPPPPPAASPPPPAVQPPPAAPPPVAVTPPPPVLVSPPTPPTIVQASPPPPPVSRPRGHQATTKKPKQKVAGTKNRGRPKPNRDRVTATTVAAVQASSIDGTLLAGGLALFVLVLADTFLLTQARGVLRGTRMV